MCECDCLFKEFNFCDITQIDKDNIPDKKGIYVIRTKEQGRNITEIIEQIKIPLEKLNWNLVAEYIEDRIRRLKNINVNKCPVIYMGSAGTTKTSKNTLRGRFDEFKTRHTIMYPLWLLIYFEWKLEYGWYLFEDPFGKEKNLKKKYKKIHGSFPALVSR